MGGIKFGRTRRHVTLYVHCVLLRFYQYESVVVRGEWGGDKYNRFSFALTCMFTLLDTECSTLISACYLVSNCMKNLTAKSCRQELEWTVTYFNGSLNKRLTCAGCVRSFYALLLVPVRKIRT